MDNKSTKIQPLCDGEGRTITHVNFAMTTKEEIDQENCGDDKNMQKQKTNNHPIEICENSTANDGLQNVSSNSVWITIIQKIQDKLSTFWKQRGELITWIFYALCIVGYAVYFGFAMSYEFGSEASIRLLWMTMLAVFIVIICIVKQYSGDKINGCLFHPLTLLINTRWTFFKWSFITIILLAITIYIIMEVAIIRPGNLLSLTGYIIYVIIFFVFSSNPAKVRWRPVCWGLGLQFLFALLVLRTSWGYNSFQWLGERVSEFLEYSNAGAKFVFGDSYEDHFFAFKVLPVVIYFSTVISVLYYLGIMQIVIIKIAWVMQKTMGTTAAESVNAAGNIFVGQTEAPLLIRPLIDKMTRSELHSVMVGGFATIAGSVLATYILFGVPANHLITASVMAAPCALAMSKLSYPEEEVTCQTSEDVANMENTKETNVIDAASAGASAAIPLVANIAANLIAFIAILEFINSTLTWMGHRVGLWPPKQELTFQLICSYILWPFAYIMGVAVVDCRKVAQLIGVKVFINEFVAYTDLGQLIENTETFNQYNGTCTAVNDDIYLVNTNTTLKGGVLQERSIVISTYALCGFANISSIGLVMGNLGSMCPGKRSIISQLAVRAMICGTAVSFMNACIAGLFYEDA